MWVRRGVWSLLAGVVVGVLSAVPAGAVVSVPSASSGQWWFDAWRMGDVWAAGATGAGVTVAVLDSGVQASRSELSGVVLEGTDFQGGDGRTDTDPDMSHGTGMAVLIAGQGGDTGLTGVAPEARILPVVLPEGSVTGGDIRWAVDHGATVINMSHAGLGMCTEGGSYSEAVRYALSKGAVLVAGAGNEGRGSGPYVPAACPGVLAVGAVDSSGDVWEKSTTGDYVDVVAPGVHMPWVLNSGKSVHSAGTSDATALTSGVVALLWSKYPQASSRQIVAMVLAGAEDVGSSGRDDATGWGMVRPWESLRAGPDVQVDNPVLTEMDELMGASPESSAGVPGSDVVAGSGGGTGGLLLVAGVAGGIVVLVVIVVVVVASRGGRRPPPPPAPGGYPGGYPYPPR